MKMALILDDSTIRREVAAGNLDVLVVLGFALNPSLFDGHVSVYRHEWIQNAFVYVSKDSGRKYLLYAEYVLNLALSIAVQTGKVPEVLKSATAQS
jgi:hypothetical protein